MDLRRLLCSVAATGLVVFASTSWSQPPSRQDLTQALEAARAAPFDDLVLDRLIGLLPTVVTPEQVRVSVLEGDLLLTREELRIHLTQSANLQKQSQTPELIVGLADGRPDVWDVKRRGRLTYAVDRSSFPTQASYDEVVRNMTLATKDWQDACPQCDVRFLHLSQFDEDPAHAKVLFIVRMLSSDGAYVAAAFFPSWAPFRRFLNIDPSYFTTSFDQVGVLRHELGHVLGYRHEHTRKEVLGCAFEDKKWKSLTPYDPQSVMHYVCGDAGSAMLKLTDVDRRGHQRQYGPPPKPIAGLREPNSSSDRITPPSALVVRFEGGEVADNIVTVAQILAKSGLVLTRSDQVQPGQVICAMYRDAMSFSARVRCPEQRMLELARMLNPEADVFGKGLKPGAFVRVPQNLELRAYQYGQVYAGAKDQERLRADTKRWHVLSAKPLSNEAGRSTRLTFEGYELKVPIADQAKLEQIVREIIQLDSANIYADATTRTLKQPVNSQPPSALLSRCREGLSDPGEANYAAMLGLPEMASCAAPCLTSDCRRSQIYLIDRPVAANADIADAMKIRPMPPLPDLKGRNSCPEVDASTDFHGTHLAGIMVSQQNGYGFIGLSPSSILNNWDTTDQSLYDSVLGERIDEEADEDTRKVFVFASLFPPYHQEDIKGGRLANPELRFQRSLAAKRIRASKALWITAAGQSTDGAGQELFTTSPLAPMNLGDLGNVVVVTACTDCSNGSASLMGEANFSPELVTIAAPGGGIPGWANASRVTTMRGTSQATAFVAGVAAAMLNCTQRPAVDIKKRLILTARPVFGDGDFQKLQSGIVDADLALRDPRTAWLKTVGAPISPVSVAAWCSRPGKELRLSDMFDDVGQATSVALAKVLRITRYLRGQSSAKWVVFHRDVEDIDKVKRTLPGRILDAPLLKLTNGHIVRANDIEELLLGTSVSKVEACNG